jgi:hypothetical protein
VNRPPFACTHSTVYSMAWLAFFAAVSEGLLLEWDHKGPVQASRASEHDADCQTCLVSPRTWHLLGIRFLSAHASLEAVEVPEVLPISL